MSPFMSHLRPLRVRSLSVHILQFPKDKRGSTVKAMYTNILHHSRLLQRGILEHSSRRFTQASQTWKWTGSDSKDHTTNADDRLDVQSDASRSGKADRSSGEGLSQATNQEDARKSNARAKEERPEAPDGPVIGMNDERGSVSKYGGTTACRCYLC